MSTYDRMTAALRQVADEADTRLAALTESLDGSRRDLAAAMTEATRLQGVIGERDDRIDSLTRAAADSDAAHAAALEEARQTIHDREATIAVLQARIKELETTTPGQNRDLLVYGTYIPGTAADALLVEGVHTDSVGLVTSIDDLKVVTGTDGVYVITNTTPDDVLTNTLFLCAVAIGTGAQEPEEDVELRNCYLAGNNPTSCFELFERTGAVPVGYASALRNWSNKHVTLIDTVLDCGWWKRNGLSKYEAWQHSSAIAGGHFTLERVLAAGFTDGVNFTGAPGNADGKQYSKVIASRLGPNFYAYNIPAEYKPQSGGYTHADGFQTNTGGNIEIAYSYIGGPRNGAAKPAWPGGTQMGDGGGNAAWMIQQEPDGRYDKARMWVDNLYFHDNWLAGGTATINLNYNAQGNTLPGATNRFVNNKIMLKIPGFNDISYYIRKRQEITTDLSGNIEWDPKGSIDGTGNPVLVHEVSNAGDGTGDKTVRTYRVPA